MIVVTAAAIALNGGFLVALAFMGDRSSSTDPATAQLKIVGFGYTSELERQEAITFGMAQTTSMINYAFAAAGALIAFVVKLLAERRAGLSVLGLFAAGLAFVSSLVGGIQALGFVPRIMTAAEFHVEGEFGLSMLYQQLTLVFGALCLLVATLPLLVVHAPAREDSHGKI